MAVERLGRLDIRVSEHPLDHAQIGVLRLTHLERSPPNATRGGLRPDRSEKVGLDGYGLRCDARRASRTSSTSAAVAGGATVMFGEQ